jgi:peptidoglycan/LPS O-acetylase OafA/YrhL
MGQTAHERDAKTGSAGRIVEIEALRGVAILMVLVEHMPLNLFCWLSPLFGLMLHYWRGAAGVDLFFAISGFVIARSLAPALRGAPPSERRRKVVAFWLRRFWRLAPAAWLWVAVPVTLSIMFNRSGAFDRPSDDIAPAIAALLNGANLCAGFFFRQHHAWITSPYWSLSLEEQFYLLFPLVLLRLGRRTIWLMFMLISYQFVMPTGVLLNLTRPGAIAAGVALALLSHHRWYDKAAPRFMLWRYWPRGGFLLAWVALSGDLIANKSAFSYGLGWGLEALVCGALVFAASFDRGYVIGGGSARRVLLWLGARSYSLYLVHMPMFALAREIAYRAGLVAQDSSGMVIADNYYLVFAVLLAIALPLLLLATNITYQWLEMPLRAHGSKIAARYEAGNASLLPGFFRA